MIQKRFDGSIEINFKVAGLDEIKQWVLGLGPEAVVMAPEELREMIQADLRKSLYQYEEGILFQEPERQDRISSTT
jgi:predicted DNA-binding transcriptional regulator YafY